MIRIELIRNNECAERVKETILLTARTGYKGDGVVAISPVESAIAIRMGEQEIGE